jgi:hypothetical protein
MNCTAGISGGWRATSGLARAGLLIGLVLVGGCAGSERGNEGRPAAVLDTAARGTVVSVNPKLRFVVMDFTVWGLPARDQRLNVYRDGHKVAEVKVSGESRDTKVAGDILTGDVQIGDQVRQE